MSTYVFSVISGMQDSKEMNQSVAITYPIESLDILKLI